MFKTIVWATDGSDRADRALPFARELASGEGRSLVVVHGKEISVAGRGGGYPVQANEEELEAKIREQAERASEDGLDVTLQIINGGSGHAAEMIVDAARENEADVIVVGTRGHAPVAACFSGASRSACCTSPIARSSSCRPESSRLASADKDHEAERRAERSAD